MGLPQSLLGGGLHGFGGLDVTGQGTGLFEQIVPLFGGGGLDPLAESLLLGAQPIGPADRLAACDIGGQQSVDEPRVLAPGQL